MGTLDSVNRFCQPRPYKKVAINSPVKHLSVNARKHTELEYQTEGFNCIYMTTKLIKSK